MTAQQAHFRALDGAWNGGQARFPKIESSHGQDPSQCCSHCNDSVVGGLPLYHILSVTESLKFRVDVRRVRIPPE